MRNRFTGVKNVVQWPADEDREMAAGRAFLEKTSNPSIVQN